VRKSAPSVPAGWSRAAAAGPPECSGPVRGPARARGIGIAGDKAAMWNHRAAFQTRATQTVEESAPSVLATWSVERPARRGLTGAAAVRRQRAAGVSGPRQDPGRARGVGFAGGDAAA
jgi:hypothetical protein